MTDSHILIYAVLSTSIMAFRDVLCSLRCLLLPVWTVVTQVIQYFFNRLRWIPGENSFDKQQTTETTLTILIQYRSTQIYQTGRENHIDRKPLSQTLNQVKSNQIKSKQIRSYLPSPHTLLCCRLLSLWQQAALHLLEKGSRAVMFVTTHIHGTSVCFCGRVSCHVFNQIHFVYVCLCSYGVLSVWMCCGLWGSSDKKNLMSNLLYNTAYNPQHSQHLLARFCLFCAERYIYIDSNADRRE